MEIKRIRSQFRVLLKSCRASGSPSNLDPPNPEWSIHLGDRPYDTDFEFVQEREGFEARFEISQSFPTHSSRKKENEMDPFPWLIFESEAQALTCSKRQHEERTKNEWNN